MSMMAMNRATKKYGPVIVGLLGLVMVVGVVVSGLGQNLSGGGGSVRTATGKQEDEPAVATVNERKITKPELDSFAQQLIERQRSQNPMAQPPTPEQMDTVRLAALETFKQQAALETVAKAAGITVTPTDLSAERDKRWNSEVRAGIAGQLKLPATATDGQINSALINLGNGATVERVKAQVLPDEQLRLGIVVEKLSNQYKTQIAVTEPAVRQSLSDMTVRHILIKFGAGALPEAQARNKAEKLLAAVKANPAQMGDLAKTNSDDTGSKATGGVYNWTPADRRNIVPEFSAALDTLKPGETFGELVRHEAAPPGYSGFHIIRLESIKPGKDFPKDFDKNKAQYVADYGKERVNKRIQDAIDAAVPSVKVTLTDPFLLAEQAIADAGKQSEKPKRDADLNRALTILSGIKSESDPLGIAPVKKAQILTGLGKTKEAIAAYEQALTQRRTPETRLALAQAYLADKQPAKVKEQLAELEKGVIPDSQAQNTIAELYKQVGDTAKAKAAQAKAQEMQKLQMDALLKQFQQQAPPAPKQPAPAK